MIINMTGGGGGGGLNFKVNAYSLLPASGSENEIAVITSTPMTGYVMQAEQPEGIVGLVWIQLGYASSAPLWVDKKHTVQIYPLRTYQYADGAWISKEALAWQNGEWKEWIIYLYADGDQLTSITGGWGTSGYSIGSAIGGFTAGSNYMSIQSVRGSYYGWGGTINAVDVTNFSKLCFNGLTSVSDAKTMFGLGSEKNGVFTVSVSPPTTRGDVFVDISNVSGLQYIKFMAGGDSKITVYKVWME